MGTPDDDFATLLEAAQSALDQACAAGGVGKSPIRQANKKLAERLETVCTQVRLPLPSDRSCNKTPKRGRWELEDSYLTEDDPRYATETACRGMLASLLAGLLEFQDCPKTVLSAQRLVAAERALGRSLVPGTGVCFRSGKPLRLVDLQEALLVSTNQVGSAELPVEYSKDLRDGGSHQSGNLQWILPDHSRVAIRDLLARNGIPKNILSKVQVKAYATDKVTMPPFFSNRDYRWATWVTSPQFATRSECIAVEVELLVQLLEFRNAPKLEPKEHAILRDRFDRVLKPNSRRCPVTGQWLDYQEFKDGVTNRKAGKSAYHVGHLDPLTRTGGHVAENVEWMTDVGNRIQGNDSMAEITRIILEAAEFHQERLRTKNSSEG